MAETLASTLNQGFDPLGIYSRIASEKNLPKRTQMAQEALPEFLSEERKAEKAKSEAERQAKLLQIEKEKELVEGYKKGVSKPREAYKLALEEERPVRPQTFNPNAGMELAAITAIMGVLTGLTGGGGRSALAALEGVTEGYRLGQQDLYERSLKDFDAAVQEQQRRITNAKAIYDLSVEEETAKKNAGVIFLKQYAPELSGTVAGEHARLGDIRAFGEDIKAMTNLARQMEIKRFEAGLKPVKSKVIPLQGINAEGKETTFMVDIEDPGFNPSNIFPGAPGVKGAAPPKGNQLKLSAAEQKDLNFRKRLMTEMEDLERLFKDDYAGFGTDALGYMSSTAQERVGRKPEMALWWSRFQNVANPERHEIYGATLTKSEQEAWRRGSIGPGNNPKFIRDWFTMRKDMLDNTISLFEIEANRRATEPTSSTQPVQSVSPKTATMKHVKATAQVRNISIEDAKQLYKNQGYSIQGE